MYTRNKGETRKKDVVYTPEIKVKKKDVVYAPERKGITRGKCDKLDDLLSDFR